MSYEMFLANLEYLEYSIKRRKKTAINIRLLKDLKSGNCLAPNFTQLLWSQIATNEIQKLYLDFSDYHTKRIKEMDFSLKI